MPPPRGGGGGSGGGKPKFEQKIVAPDRECLESRAAAFSHCTLNVRTISGIYAGDEKFKGTLLLTHRQAIELSLLLLSLINLLYCVVCSTLAYLYLRSEIC